ncbi:MAG: hypothetical protein ACD_63C00070G0010 [uncultured bacterium]|nr:MAG: hypothetical protein ACD_63C00070G0010 [uncultured bacterium]
MSNSDFSKIFSEISRILELRGTNNFKVSAYRNAGREIEHMAEDLEDIYKEKGVNGLVNLTGIGESIAEKIEELIKTGKCKYYENLKKKIPKVELEMLNVPGIGAKTARKLYKELNLRSLSDLEEKAKAGKVRELEGFRARTEENILQSLKSLRERKKITRYLLTFAEPIAQDVLKYLKKCKDVKKCDVVGSLRRMKETVGDIDLIVGSSNPEKVIEHFVKYPNKKKVILKGDTKGAILHKEIVQIDLEVLPMKNYGSLLQHFTGSKEHNVHLRTWAKKEGYSISEYGVIKGKARTHKLFSDEQDFYKYFGMQNIPPELREDRGEIEAALEDKLPKFVDFKDIKGDLHMHSESSDARSSLEELIAEARKLGYEYIAISEHAEGLGITQGLSGRGLLKQHEKIQSLNKKSKSFRVLSSVEANIMADGKLDISDDVLSKLDIVTVSVHSSFRQSEAKMTKRLITAIRNPNVDVIGHPSGRLLLQRDPYEVDWLKIFKEASKNKVALEINAHPERLDLRDDLIKSALKFGVKFAVNTDAHSVDGLHLMKYGVATARRGWAEASDVINTFSLEDLFKWLENVRNA